MQLTSENVETTFVACLRDSGTIIDGLITRAYMDAEGQVENITALLSQLPDNFQKSKGGGWSFTQACVDKDGNQWTDFHVMMEKLVMLGIAADLIEFQFPRKMWSDLPGGVPYFCVKD